MTGHTHRKTIADIAAGHAELDTFRVAAKAAGLMWTLKYAGPFTLFAPTDSAFESLPKGVVDALLRDREKLTAVLTYHLVPAKLAAAGFAEGHSAKLRTVFGSALHAHRRDGRVQVNDAALTTTDLVASNGVVHIIDSVLIPGGQPCLS